MQIHFEDEYIIAVEKPAKLFVHPMPGERESKNCLLFQVRDHHSSHVYAINRLDRPVSGIVLFAKRNKIVPLFQEIWHTDSTIKKYECLHRGKLTEQGKFNSALSKRGTFKSVNKEIKQEALTLYRPIEYFESEYCTHTEVEIKTGRYHQIRRHFRKAVMPLIGDSKHGKGKINNHFREQYELHRIFLHSKSLEFHHPVTKEAIKINSDLPQELESVLLKLKEQV